MNQSLSLTVRPSLETGHFLGTMTDRHRFCQRIILLSGPDEFNISTRRGHEEKAITRRQWWNGETARRFSCPRIDRFPSFPFRLWHDFHARS